MSSLANQTTDRAESAEEAPLYENDLYRVYRTTGSRAEASFAPMVEGEALDDFAERMLVEIQSQLRTTAYSDVVRFGFRTHKGFRPLPADPDPNTVARWCRYAKRRAYQVEPPIELSPGGREWWLVQIAGILSDIFHASNIEEKFRLTFLLGRQWQRFHADSHFRHDLAARKKQKRALANHDLTDHNKKKVENSSIMAAIVISIAKIKVGEKAYSSYSHLAESIVRELGRRKQTWVPSKRTVLRYLAVARLEGKVALA